MQHVAMDKLKGTQVIKPRYDNFIGGKWVAPVRGQYFKNVTPITGQEICEIARSTDQPPTGGPGAMLVHGASFG